jgi:Putative Actinobacterial Holin-X, holin superfamily III
VRDERSLLDVLTDIFVNLEDIVRSELRLARAELATELGSVRWSVLGLGIATVAGILSVQFLLLSGMYALRFVLTPWGAALVMAGAAALVSMLTFLICVRGLRARQDLAPRTTKSIKENLEWAQASIK